MGRWGLGLAAMCGFALVGAGCVTVGTNCRGPGGIGCVAGAVAIVAEGARQQERSARIMGEPQTVEATHALAEAAAWYTFDAELVQPDDSCPHDYGYPHESAVELSRPRPRR